MVSNSRIEEDEFDVPDQIHAVRTSTTSRPALNSRVWRYRRGTIWHEAKLLPSVKDDIEDPPRVRVWIMRVGRLSRELRLLADAK